MIKPMFDVNHHLILPTIILCHRDKRRIGILNNIEDLSIDVDLNQNYETSFKIYKEVDGVKNPYWDDIIDLKLIYLVEYNEYFEIEVKTDESNNTCKSVTAVNLVSSELSQTILYDVEINTEIDIERDDYVMAKIYDDEDPQDSLLGRVLSKAPHYSIKHVDSTLYDLVRVFSINDKSIYDFLTSDLADEIHCLIIPHSDTRQISVYDLYDTCDDCGYRGENLTYCPECNSTDIIKGYGKNTNVYVSVDNLAESVSISTNKGEVKNTFRVQGGDDEITTAVAAINPNGSTYIMRFSQEMFDDMSNDLRTKIQGYNTLYESKKAEYKANTANLYNAIDQVQYYTSSMSPKVDPEDHTLEEEIAKLTAAKLGNIAVQKLSTASETTVNKTVLEYAKIFMDSGFNLEIVTENNYNKANKTWRGKFKVSVQGYDYSNATSEEELQNSSITSDYVTLNINEDYETFIRQKMAKILADYEIRTDVVYDYTKYALNRLQSFSDAYQSCLDILIQQNISDPNNTLHSFYTTYYNTKIKIDKEILVREKQVENAKASRDNYIAIKDNIQSQLNFKNYLGTTLYKEYCAYRREQSYTNDNYISDGLVPDQDTTMSDELNRKILEMAEELIDAANKELYKASETQYTITADLGDLFAMQEFAPLYNNLGLFEIGNWITVGADDKLFRLRLLSYTISDSDIAKLSVTFSNVTRIYNGYSDIQSVLSKAQSMATSYGAVTNQVKKTTTTSDTVSGWIENGLDASLTQIKSSKDQNITYDSHGLLCRQYESTTETYEDEQIKIINNCIAFTEDDWESVSTALGKITYYDPTDEKYKTAYGLIGEAIIGDLLLGKKLVVSNEDNTIVIDGTGVTLDGGAITWSNPIDGDNIKNLNSTLGVTHIDANSVISPKIQGGYLYINKTNGCSVEINPLGISGYGNDAVLRVADKNNNSLLNIDKNGNATFKGTVYATSGEFSGKITSNEGKIGGIDIGTYGIHISANGLTSGFNTSGDTVFWAGAEILPEDDTDPEDPKKKHFNPGFRVYKTGECAVNVINIGEKIVFSSSVASSATDHGIFMGTKSVFEYNSSNFYVGDSNMALNLYGSSIKANDSDIITLDDLLPKGDITVVVNKPTQPVSGQSYYEYFVPLPCANKRRILLKEVLIRGYPVSLKNSCSVQSTNSVGLIIRDTNTNGAGTAMTVTFTIS